MTKDTITPRLSVPVEDHVILEPPWQRFLEEAAAADQAVESGEPIYAADDVHAYLERIARGKPSRPPEPWRG